MKSKTALLARSRRLAAQARPCPPQRPPRPRPPRKPRRWRPTPMAVDYPALPELMDVDEEEIMSRGAPSPSQPCQMDWEFTGTPVQRGWPIGPAAKRACPLSPLVVGKKRRSAPTPPSSPACRSPSAKRQAYEPVNSPVVPAASVAAYSPGWLSPPRFFPSPFSPLVPLAPSPVPSLAPEPTQESLSPSRRSWTPMMMSPQANDGFVLVQETPSPPPCSRSPTMPPQAYEDFVLVQEFDEATEALANLRMVQALEDVVNEPAQPEVDLEVMDEEEYARLIQQAETKEALQEVTTQLEALLNRPNRVDGRLEEGDAP